MQVSGEWANPNKHGVIQELITVALSALDLHLLGVKRHGALPPKIEVITGHSVVRHSFYFVLSHLT